MRPTIIAAALPAVHALNYNVTAISARDGASILECWKLATPFAHSNQDGLRGTMSSILGGVGSNLTFNVVPAGFVLPAHTAPVNQWVFLLSGVVSLVLPESKAEWTVEGGEFGVLFASDTPAVSRQGHSNKVLGNTEALLLQIPTADGEIPKHFVLHAGPCTPPEMTGVRGAATQSYD